MERTSSAQTTGSENLCGESTAEGEAAGVRTAIRNYNREQVLRRDHQHRRDHHACADKDGQVLAHTWHEACRDKRAWGIDHAHWRHQ